MRPTCTFCARKHLGQAIVLLGEAVNGYPDHIWLAIGHLAEASDELNAFPAYAAEIRGYRKQLEVAVPPALPALPLMEMITRISALDAGPSPHPNPHDPAAGMPRVAADWTPPANIGYATVGRPDHSQRLDTGPVTLADGTVITPAGGVSSTVRLSIGDAATKSQERVGHHMADGGLVPVREPAAAAAMVPGWETHPDVLAAKAAAQAKYGTPEKATAALYEGLGQAPGAVGPDMRCLQCEDKAHLRNLAAQFVTEGPFRGRVVIMTTLGNFSRSYSLSSVVLEQAHAIANAGYRTIILVQRGCDMSECPPLPPEISVLPIVPALLWRQDEVDRAKAAELAAAMSEWLQAIAAGLPEQQRVSIITHDLLFQRWFVTFAAAIHLFSTSEQGQIVPNDPAVERNLLRRRLRWFHIAHSSIGARPRITATPSAGGHGVIDPKYWRHTLPDGHTLLVLNYSDVPHFRAYYHDMNDQPLGEERVVTLKNPRDIRPFLNMSQRASMLTTRYRLHLADISVLYPLSMDRVAEKGMREVLQLLCEFKRSGMTVRLVVAAANASGFPEKVAWVKEQARAAGLITHGPPARMFSPEGVEYQGVGATIPDSELEVIITSEALGEEQIQANGLPPEDISSLFHVTNLFIFPTISEAGPLVLLEAALAGCTLVLNASLPCLRDYIGLPGAIWVPWGSLKGGGKPPEGEALRDLVMRIWSRMQSDRGAYTKRQIMITHSLESYGEELSMILEHGGRPPETTDRSGDDGMGGYTPADVIHPADAGPHRPAEHTDQDEINAAGEARINAAVGDSAALRQQLDEQPAAPHGLGYDPDAAP